MKHGGLVFLSDPFSAPVKVWIRQDIQLPDVVEWVCAKFPGASVRLSTFSVAEESLRRLFMIRRTCGVREMHVLIDRKATLKTIKLRHFISQVFTSARLADIHAKLCIFSWPDGRRLLLVTSQNLTRGGRFESSALISHPQCVDEALNTWDYISREKSMPIAELVS